MKTDLLSRLTKVKQTGRDAWVACCPAHDDRSPSLTIRLLDDGRILLHCFAGCEPLAVLGAIGLDFSDLFPESLEHGKPLRRPFPAADVLECLSQETKIVAFVADRINKGLKVSESDMSRFKVAIGRIETGREIANG